MGSAGSLASILAVAYAASRTKRPLLRGLASSFCGAAALGAVNLLAPYTGVGLVVNFATAFVSVVLSVPGVIMLLILRLLLLF